jgi:hypothetical protein
MYLKKYLSFINESIQIHLPELLEDRFGIKYEILEDYLTEISDSYFVRIYENNRTPRARAAIVSMKKFEILEFGFTVLIANSESGLSDNKVDFDKNDVLQKMESVCKRLMEYSIIFQSFNVINGSNDYICIEYNFKLKK